MLFYSFNFFNYFIEIYSNQALYNLHSSIKECHAEVIYDKRPTVIADKTRLAEYSRISFPTQLNLKNLMNPLTFIFHYLKINKTMNTIFL